MQMSRRPKPTTTRPMTAPLRNATCRPRFRECRQPSAVRDDASVAVFIPMNPQMPEKSPPVRKATGTNGFWIPMNARAVRRMASTAKTIPTTLYCRRR